MRSSFLLTLIFFLIVLTVSSQTTVNISAAADNTIYQNPAGNSNALGQNIFSGTSGGNSPRRGLIRFDVAAAIPANAIITAVTLRLNCNLSRSVADNVSLHKLLASWGEGTSNAGSVSDGTGEPATANDATWATRFFPSILWTTAGGDYSSTASATVSISNTGFYQWNSAAMVSDVQNWINTPASNFGWILICNETVASTARKFGSRENATVANRPSLSVTYTTSLPVTLSYFKATPKNNGVQLSWETSQEINNDYFEVLHSTDGIRFWGIGKVNGNGTSSASHQYNFSHHVITQGINFYKLAQVDFDGNRKYSTVQKVFLSLNFSDVYLLPNPVLSDFRLSKAPPPNSIYKIINASGTVMLSGLLSGGNLSVDKLTPGTYYLCIYQKAELTNMIIFTRIRP